MHSPQEQRWARMFAEHGTLVASLFKWTLLAATVGVLAGVGTAVFLRVLAWSVGGMADAPVRLLWLPVGFVVAYFLVRFLAPDAAGHGTDKVIEAVHRRSGRIPVAVAPVKLAATVVTIAVGGSVGKEGPAAQIGASLASGLSSVLRLGRRDRRKVVICGIGAGFATVFGTPIAGAIFGLEVLVLGSLMYDVLYPSFVAGIVGYHVASQLGVQYFHHTLPSLPAPTERIFGAMLLAGVVFGLVALLLIEVLRWVHGLANRVRAPGWMVAAGGGGLLAVGAWLCSERYLGLGLATLEAAVRGEAIPPEAALLKILFTAVSLGVGGSGGIVTPIFFIGAAAGSTLARVMGLDPGVFAAVGMVAVLAGAANAPLAASVMAIELFGPGIGPYAAIAAIVAFMMSGHRSVYPSQVLGMPKTRSLSLRRGAEMGDEPEIDARLARVRWRAFQRMLAQLRRRPRA
ncbi:MAG TPA: chloride channel protein [Candidatus Nitrosotalea sp.]|nr:chloride channel protein [Candidatus Nitrosotalea sp.]